MSHPQTPQTDTQQPTLSPEHATTITNLSTELDTDIESLTLHEGTQTGKLYIEQPNGSENGNEFHRVTVTETGLTVTPTPSLTEPCNEVTHIEPAETETIQDALDNITFTGD